MDFYLVIPTVKSGERSGEQFWGCAAYSKCRLTQKITWNNSLQ